MSWQKTEVYDIVYVVHEWLLNVSVYVCVLSYSHVIEYLLAYCDLAVMSVTC